MGIRQAREANLALLAKIGWALETNKDSIPCNVLRCKYLSNISLQEAVRRPDSSSTWRGILNCRPLLLKGGRWLIGNGRQVNVWRDWWVGDCPLEAIATGPIDDMLNWTVDRLITVDRQWNLASIEHVLPQVCLQQILATPLPFAEDREDKLVWSGESSGLFSAKSAFLLLQAEHIRAQELPDLRWLWRCRGTERMRFFLWLLYQDKLNTNVNRARRQPSVSVLCPTCLASTESSLHLFRDCVFDREVWDFCFVLGGPPTNFFSMNLQDWLRVNCTSSEQFSNATTWAVNFVATLWCVWKRRNALVFQNGSEPAGRVWLRASHMGSGIEKAYVKFANQVPKQATWVKWQKPPFGWYVLNTDGAVKHETGLASAGGLIRDSNGVWISGFAMKVGITDSLSAELWGLREGLRLAKSLNLSNIVVQLDASVVVNFLTQGIPPTHLNSVLVQEASALVKGDWVREITHVYREGNRCADFLANFGQDIPQGSLVLMEPPAGLLPLIEHDANGIAIRRL